MAQTLPMPPDPQLRPLLDGYARSVAARRRTVLIGVALLLVATLLSGIGAEVRLSTFWDKLGNFGSYFGRLTELDTGKRVWTDVPYWFWGLRRWSLQLGETLLIAYVGTATGTMLGIAGAVLASRNLSRSGAMRFATIRLLEFCRTVPDIVFALIFVVAFGLGALPGVLAITLHTTGTLGKLFAEVIENIDMRPVEGVQGTGGTWLSQLRFGALPQVLSNFASYALLRFEINVRGAAVIGFVGAGGIGQELIVAIRKFYYSDVSAILLMLLVCVMLIDYGLGEAALRSARHGARTVTVSFEMEFQSGRGDVLARHAAVLDRRARGRTGLLALALGALGAYAAGLFLLDLSPLRIWQGLDELGVIVVSMMPPSPGGHFTLYLDALGQTLSIAFLGTLLAAVGAVPLGFLAARNVIANRVAHILTRRSLDTVRSIDTLVWALIWIDVVGLGPFAGALAIACSDLGALAKVMSEAIEVADRKPVEGVVASGGGRLAAIRFGIVPQVLPVMASQLLYFFESNTRSATIIGIVGAGGIGLHLYEQIRVLEWQQVSFLILMVLATVAAIDFVSRQLRLAIIGRRSG